MSKSSVLVLVVAAVVIGFSLHGDRQTAVGPAAAEESPRTREAPKWEYKVIDYGYGYKDMKARDKAFTDALNKLGKDGWEYCGPLTTETIIETKVTGFTASAGSRSFVVFKRPRGGAR
jgi:hypothetical protein